MSTSEQKGQEVDDYEKMYERRHTQALFDETLEAFRASKQGAGDVAKMLTRLEVGQFANVIHKGESTRLDGHEEVDATFFFITDPPKWKEAFLELLGTVKDTLQVRHRGDWIDVKTRESKNAPDDWTGFIVF
jgi:hypothetical protein